MRLAPRELDKLRVLVPAAMLAQRRLARGLRLNSAEAVALLSLVVLEWVRDAGALIGDQDDEAISVAGLMDRGRRVLGRHVLIFYYFLYLNLRMKFRFGEFRIIGEISLIDLAGCSAHVMPGVAEQLHELQVEG